MRFTAIVLAGLACFTVKHTSHAQETAALTPIQTEMVKYLDSIRTELVSVNQDIWTFAEVGLEEHRSAARLIGVLKKAGFKVQEGVAGMPTAFIAEYGSGAPVIAILAEYDALPELSQEITGERKAAPGRTTGHGCGHCALGTAAVGAALAVKEVYNKHQLKGTIRLYGTPAEETLIGKIYMLLAGLFNGVDVCLHWHPGSKNRVAYSSSKACISAKFTFSGLAAHASGSPDKGRSALDGVELMNVGANYMREHIKETSRIHYVITNGGAQPNVVPATAQVWYYVRANNHQDLESHFDWLKDIGEAGAKMSRTKVQLAIDTDCHEIIPNLPLSRLILKHMKQVGAPRFDADDENLARQLQTSLRVEFGLKEPKALESEVEELPAKPYQDAGSTDVGDISWHVPTSGLSVACFAAGSPGHSWQNVAAAGSPIAHKGIMVAAKVLALSAVDMLQNTKVLDEAKADFQERMKNRPYTTVPMRTPYQDWGWAYQILSFLEQNNVWENPDDQAVAGAIIPLYFCPSRRSPEAFPGMETTGLAVGSPRGAIDYAGNGGTGPSIFPDSDSLLNQNGVVIPCSKRNYVSLTNIPDGASNTILVGERNFNKAREGQSLEQFDENNGYFNGWDWDTIRWGYDVPIPDRSDDSYYSLLFGSSHQGGCQFVFADGAVRMLYYDISLEAFKGLCTRDGGEVVSEY